MFKPLLDYLFELVLAFGTQITLVLGIVALIKEATGIQGWVVRIVSFVIGLIPGGLFLWVFIESVPDLPLSNKVLIGFLFMVAAGLSASGLYDLKNDFRLKE